MYWKEHSVIFIISLGPCSKQNMFLYTADEHISVPADIPQEKSYRNMTD